MPLLETIGVSLLTGVLSSFLFLLSALLILRPKLRVSEFICEGPDEFTGIGLAYVFKVYNASWFSAFDMSMQLSLSTRYNGRPHGTNRRLINVKLVRDSLKYIPRYRRLHKKSDGYAGHCILFRTNEDLPKMIEPDDKSLELQITLRHGLSGLSRVYKQTYRKGAIRKGEFKFGNCLEVC